MLSSFHVPALVDQVGRFLVEVDLFFIDVLPSDILNSYSPLLKSLELTIGCLFRMGCIMSKEEELLEILLLPFQAALNDRKLIIITHPLFS